MYRLSRWLLACLITLTLLTAAEEPPLRIGVLANRGPEEAMRRWQPTADYLAGQIPGMKFVIVPLDFEEIFVAAKNGSIDIVIANSAIYVEMEYLYGVSRIVTLKNLRNGVVCKNFGGVIFTRDDRKDIQTLRDLKNRSFMAVDDSSMGGCLMAWREIKQAGVDPQHGFSSQQFGGTHDAVIHAVLEGRVEAGTVRTDLFERIAAEGKIDITQFRVLNAQTKTSEFPFVRSTRLYPEWPAAKVRHTSDDAAQKIAIALLNLPQNSEAARASESAGWTVPLDYNEVHECLKELRMGPYKDYGRIGWRDVVGQYWLGLMAIGLALILLTAAVIKVQGLNRRLRQSAVSLEDELAERRRVEERLQAARAELETRVADRTRELAQANEELRAEVVERRRALEELKQSTDRFRQLAENIRQVFWVRDCKTDALLYASPAFETVFRMPVDEVYQRPRAWLDRVHPDDKEDVIRALPNQHKDKWECEYRVVHPDGAMFWLRARAFPVRDSAGEIYRIVGLTEDITESRMLKEQLLQAQKMEAIGQLSGGVAHDFNNLLTVISSCCELMLQDAEGNAQLATHLNLIQSTVQRGSLLTQQLLAFSRRQVLAPQILDINAVIHNLSNMLPRLITENIRLSLSLDPKIGCVRADVGQIQQVLMNLIINARDAMPAGGELNVSTSPVNMDKDAARQITGLAEGCYVLLRVADTGIGMDPETQRRAFEPFFTTKIGKGTGLGLATVYGIVQQSGGAICFQSDPGRGTTFSVYLPKCNEPLSSAKESALPAPRQGAETLLLVEDETMLREVLGGMLRLRGYTVIGVASGDEALRVFKSRQHEIDIVLTDMLMPGISGWQLCVGIRALRPDCPVLIMSGYTPEASTREAMQQPGMAFLQKPFTQEQLDEKIRAIFLARAAVT